MGGSAGLGGGVGLGLGALATLIPGLQPYGAALLLGGLTAGTTVGSAIDANQATQKAKGQQNQLLDEQRTEAAAMQKTLLEQPKNISPDNFLANKASQLANLRLGLASTVTGMPGVPSPVLSSPSLTAGGGKTKLGQ